MTTSSEKTKADLSPKPAIKRWTVFLIVAFALLMITIDATIVATALHTLREDLHTSISWAGWTLTAYSLGFVLMLPLSAKLSTQFGHRRIFMASILVFVVASLFCGLSNNIFLLIVMRVIQAIGGAGITPSATGIIVEYFGKGRAQFLGLFGSIFATGAMIGPIFGGIIVSYWSWDWIFFINIPLGLAVLILSLQYIPKDKESVSQKEKMDLKGLLLMGLSILSAMYAATFLGEPDTQLLSPVFIGLLLVFFISVVLLVRHLKRIKEPFIQPRFIFGKGFGAVNLLNVIQSGMVIGATSLVPIYAISEYGISELKAGTLLVANGIASVVLSVILSIYINRSGYRLPLYVGGLVIATGVVLLALPPQFGWSPFIWLAFCTFFIGAGMGIMSPAGRNAGISLAPEQSANIAAVRSVGIQIGQIITIAGTTAIIAGDANPSHSQAMVYIGLAVIFVITLPIVSRVPEIKGAW